MIVQTLKRTLIAAAIALTAPALFAAFPSARTGPRMAFDEDRKIAVLFGGATLTDLGTARQYQPDETWHWDGERWIQQYPAHHPSGRDSHAMVYDPVHKNIVLFGGRSAAADLGDTWIYENSDWREVTSPAPSKRVLPGMAFDRKSNRIVLFGGSDIGEEGTVTAHHDTWAFDGTAWTQLLADGPAVNKPLLVFDEKRERLLMLAIDEKFDTKMYAFNSDSSSWEELTPETRPQCVNESGLVYQRTDEKVFLVGGACAVEGNQSSTTDEVWTWDGENWSKPEIKTALLRVTSAAIAYDTERNTVVMFGGTTAFASPRASTYRFVEGDWAFLDDPTSPGPRSLFGLATDPATKTTYLVGGLTDLDYWTDFWKYHDGSWERLSVENGPQCALPVASFDSDRSRLVVLCPDSSTYEFDGEAWKKGEPKKVPPSRRFSSMVYDQTMKKTVLFGGYDDQGEYTGRTWLWDGSNWSELKKKKPHSRALTSMWFDPTLKKTVLFGGLGRRDTNAKIERYTDMWTLDSNGWKELKPAAMPTTRYGAQSAVDPRTNHVILFGGLRLEIAADGRNSQVYADDTWEWDGTTWRKIETAAAATPRENGAMFFDPSTERLILFGGWAGYFHSDLWAFENGAWHVVPQQ